MLLLRLSWAWRSVLGTAVVAGSAGNQWGSAAWGRGFAWASDLPDGGSFDAAWSADASWHAEAAIFTARGVRSAGPGRRVTGPPPSIMRMWAASFGREDFGRAPSLMRREARRAVRRGGSRKRNHAQSSDGSAASWAEHGKRTGLEGEWWGEAKGFATREVLR
jgi:hypothetical protein